MSSGRYNRQDARNCDEQPRRTAYKIKLFYTTIIYHCLSRDVQNKTKVTKFC